MLITRLLLVLEVWNENQPIENHELGIFWCGWISIGPLLQGQMRIAKLKSAYNSLIIGPRGLEWKTNL